MWGNDVFTFNSTSRRVSGWSLPIYTPVNGEPPSGIGLGRNSTLLAYLYSAGIVASRTWSLFYGYEGAEKENQMDGSLIFGGYDKAKVTGPNYTQPITTETNCTSNLVIEVTDINVNMPNGTTTSLMRSRNVPSFEACIEPEGRVIELSNDLWEEFVSVAGGRYIAESRSLIWAQNFLADGV